MASLLRVESASRRCTCSCRKPLSWLTRLSSARICAPAHLHSHLPNRCNYIIVALRELCLAKWP